MPADNFHRHHRNCHLPSSTRLLTQCDATQLLPRLLPKFFAMPLSLSTDQTPPLLSAESSARRHHMHGAVSVDRSVATAFAALVHSTALHPLAPSEFLTQPNVPLPVVAIRLSSHWRCLFHRSTTGIFAALVSSTAPHALVPPGDRPLLLPIAAD